MSDERDLPECEPVKVWVWSDREGNARFEPFPGATGRREFTIPLGWSLRPCVSHGVVLASIRGMWVTALTLASGWVDRDYGIRETGWKGLPTGAGADGRDAG